MPWASSTSVHGFQCICHSRADFGVILGDNSRLRESKGIADQLGWPSAAAALASGCFLSVWRVGATATEGYTTGGGCQLQAVASWHSMVPALWNIRVQ